MVGQYQKIDRISDWTDEGEVILWVCGSDSRIDGLKNADANAGFGRKCRAMHESLLQSKKRCGMGK